MVANERNSVRAAPAPTPTEEVSSPGVWGSCVMVKFGNFEVSQLLREEMARQCVMRFGSKHQDV